MNSLYSNTIKDLSECYNTHAQKFSSTRKKIRPEMKYTLDHIYSLSQEQQRPLHIVELWCGDWRLLRELQNQYPDVIKSYTGVDISSELLTIANKESSMSTSIQRINDDMIWYLSKQANESIDIIITMASYQHLPDKSTRSEFLQQLYRTLRYEWKRLSIDRSWSQWMLQKHYQPLLQSLKQFIITWGRRERNNLLIPFRDQGETHYRLYHIHTINEIQQLTKQYWLQIIERQYSSQNWDFHHKLRRARNICLVAKKTIYDS